MYIGCFKKGSNLKKEDSRFCLKPFDWKYVIIWLYLVRYLLFTAHENGGGWTELNQYFSWTQPQSSYLLINCNPLFNSYVIGKFTFRIQTDKPKWLPYDRKYGQINAIWPYFQSYRSHFWFSNFECTVYLFQDSNTNTPFLQHPILYYFLIQAPKFRTFTMWELNMPSAIIPPSAM
jgi:hypothetical protein